LALIVPLSIQHIIFTLHKTYTCRNTCRYVTSTSTDGRFKATVLWTQCMYTMLHVWSKATIPRETNFGETIYTNKLMFSLSEMNRLRRSSLGKQMCILYAKV